jgi:N-acetylneuraminic acid mutarotase
MNGQMAYFCGDGLYLKIEFHSNMISVDASMFVYNTATNTTHEATSMPQGLGGYAMTTLTNDTLLVCGGYERGVYMYSCSLYVVGVNTWASFASMPAGVAFFAMLTLYDRPYIFGGTNSSLVISNLVYTFETNMWNARAHMVKGLVTHGAAVVDADTALV